jgi:type III secretion system FlhB-like substrate exporter
MFIAIVTTFFFNQTSYAKEIAGEIVSVDGVAFIRPDKSTGPLPKSPPRAKAGDNVYVGDVINTSSEGAVKILMRDKSIVDLGASSLFKVDEYLQNNGNNRKAKLNLAFGKVRVAVTRKIEGGGSFQVKTRGATMGVRGTEFVVKSNVPASLSRSDKSPEAIQERASPKKPEVMVAVLQGKVDVTSAPKVNAEGQSKVAAPVVSLTAGTQLSTGGNVVSAQPVKISETQMNALKVETKIPDNTFAKAITIDVASSNDSGGGRSPASEGNGMGQLLTMVPMSDLPQIPTDSMPPIDVPGNDRNNNNMNNINSPMRKLSVNIIVQN